MHLFRMIFATAVVAFGVGSVSYAGQPAVRFKVPFAFEVGGTTLPAGEYQVVENSTQIFRVTGLDTKKQVLLVENPGGALASLEADSQIVFKQYANRYFLHQLYEGNTRRIREFSGGKPEKAARAASQDEPRLVVVAAR